SLFLRRLCGGSAARLSRSLLSGRPTPHLPNSPERSNGMSSAIRCGLHSWVLSLAVAGGSVLSMAPLFVNAASTPIQHVIIVVGENHTFDNVFGVYRPPHGEAILNLLSQGIVDDEGKPGPNFHRAQQRTA